MKVSLPNLARSLLSAEYGNRGHRYMEEKAVKLSNGAELAVNVDPFDSVLYLPPGRNVATPLHVQGTARVGHGHEDVHYIYILDTSGSTEEPDGDCGTVLDCMVTFFQELHQEIQDDGSAKFISFIEFDWDANIVESLHQPSNFTFANQTSDDITVCSRALEKATEVINDPANTADTNIVIFAGDGYCNGGLNLTQYADDLGSTGAIVHSVAVGDAVNCTTNGTDTSSSLSHLSEIPRNGGRCLDLESPEDHDAIVDGILGTWLNNLELKVDHSDYIEFENSKGEVSKELPSQGASTVRFSKKVEDLEEGTHFICVRATGQDSLGDEKQVESCSGLMVQQDTWLPALDNGNSSSSEDSFSPETSPDLTLGSNRNGLEVSGLVVLLLLVVVAGFCSYRRLCRQGVIEAKQGGLDSQTATSNVANDLQLDESGAGKSSSPRDIV